MYTIDIYNRLPPSKANRAGLGKSPVEKMQGEIPSLGDFRPFGCRGYALIPVHGKAHKSHSEQVMYMRKEFSKIGGARLCHTPTNTFGTSGHVKWHLECLYDPNLPKYDVSARIQGIGRLEDYQFLVGTTRFDDEDGLKCVTKKVYVGKSPVGLVILVSWSPVIKGGWLQNF